MQKCWLLATQALIGLVAFKLLGNTSRPRLAHGAKTQSLDNDVFVTQTICA
jgi:hypothetical protein